MSVRSTHLTDKLYHYLLAVSLRDDRLLRRLRRETERMPMGGMQISREQGQFMGLLVELMGAKKALEVGTFTGYSSLCVARALPADGRLVCCDVSEAFTRIARKYWQEAGVARKVTLELGPALRTLDRLIAGGSAGSFDFAFIDADKSNYRNYYERCLELVRPGGLIAVEQRVVGRQGRGCAPKGRRHQGDPRLQQTPQGRPAHPSQRAPARRRPELGAQVLLSAARGRRQIKSPQLPKIGWMTRSPGLILSRDAVPLLSSSTASIGSPEEMVASENGTVRSAIWTMRPSRAMKSMSSGR